MLLSPYAFACRVTSAFGDIALHVRAATSLTRAAILFCGSHGGGWIRSGMILDACLHQKAARLQFGAARHHGDYSIIRGSPFWLKVDPLTICARLTILNTLVGPSGEKDIFVFG